MTPKIMIILGSGSDIAIAEKSMDILDKLEIPYKTLYKRLKRGWDVKRAFCTPKMKNQYI